MDIKIDINSQAPIYKQIIQNVEQLVDTGRYKTGDFLPSMNSLAGELQISKETIKKAYNILRDRGLIESTQGKGFYIAKNGNDKIKILILFDKISTYKQVLYNSLIKNITDISEISIRLHNQDIALFEHFIEENLNLFDYYIVTPHFPFRAEIQKRTIRILKKIPNRKLILLDRYIDGLPGNFGSVYQDFENDIYEGLSKSIDTLKQYKKLNVISMPGSLYSPLIKKGIKKFCFDNKINYEIHKDIIPKKIQKKEAFLILNSQLDHELIELVKAAKMKNCRIGKDIGIISYNESPINEIILDGLTVLSTDFEQMGELTAKMIINKSFKKVKCNFHLIQRSTF